MSPSQGLSRAHQAPVSRTLTIIGAVVVTEPISATLLFPFVYFMIRSFNTVEEQYVGYWAGLITSAFFVPQMLTATLWGIVSDRLGRKPIIIIGLVGSAISIILFGLSTSLTWAILSRALCGLFNGNAGVARTAVGELAHNLQLDQGKAFSLFGFCSAIGYVIGPLLGGYLANPATKLSFQGPGNVFAEYPYLLPCLVCGGFDLAIAVIAFFLLEETNTHVFVSRKTISEDDEEEVCEPQIATENSRLLGEAIQRDGSQDLKQKPQYSVSTMSCILGIVCISFHAIIFDEIYAVFAATCAPSGLCFTSNNIATSLSVMGPVIFGTQLLLFPRLSSRFSALSLWRCSAIVSAVVYPMFSLLPSLSGEEDGAPRGVLLWCVLFSLLLLRFAANVIGYTSMAILLNKVALPEKRGAIMGVAQTAISLGRATGPAIGGALWSWSLGNGLPAPFDYRFIFLFEGVLAILQVISSLKIET